MFKFLKKIFSYFYKREEVTVPATAVEEKLPVTVTEPLSPSPAPIVEEPVEVIVEPIPLAKEEPIIEPIPVEVPEVVEIVPLIEAVKFEEIKEEPPKHIPYFNKTVIKGGYKIKHLKVNGKNKELPKELEEHCSKFIEDGYSKHLAKLLTEHLKGDGK